MGKNHWHKNFVFLDNFSYYKVSRGLVNKEANEDIVVRKKDKKDFNRIHNQIGILEKKMRFYMKVLVLFSIEHNEVSITAAEVFLPLKNAWPHM